MTGVSPHYDRQGEPRDGGVRFRDTDPRPRVVAEDQVSLPPARSTLDDDLVGSLARHLEHELGIGSEAMYAEIIRAWALGAR